MILSLALVTSTSSAAIQQTVRLEGVVLDQSGAAVAGAEVSLKSGPATLTQKTGSDGRFVFEQVALKSGSIICSAPGFAKVERSWAANGAVERLDFTLQPEPISDQITVAATRTEERISETAASVTLLSRNDLSTTAAATLDDALRQVPGFSLFRRSGSRTANPTSQGVSLRGVGASGASRAAVLADGIPLNDPFGGWVYWGRVPREAISRAELIRGGASHLYGSDALGGVISFIPRREVDSTLSVEASYGNQETPSGSVFASGSTGQWRAGIAAQSFQTEGYILVDEDERGIVDTAAGADFSMAELTLERLLSDRGRLFLRASLFGETRENGTPLQTNRTHIRQIAFGFDHQDSAAGAFSARVYSGAQIFDQDFSAIAANRNSETLTRSQRVPAQQTGFSGQWSRPFGLSHTLVAGLDGREVRGASDELVFVGGRLSSAVGAGGRERTLGLFGEDIIRLRSRWLLTVAARVDRWRHYDALSTSQPLAVPGRTAVTEFAERDETAFSPRVSLLHKLTDEVSISASGYRAFRAPTLNELYRTFRVGNVITLANDKLQAERLTGAEVGGGYSGLQNRFNLRGMFFWAEVTRPVANVTLTVTPDLITRQRQNLGRTRSAGIEVDATARVTHNIFISGGYLFVDATVREFPANSSLEGLQIPQVPRNQFTIQGRYANPSVVTLALQGRFVGDQFDDDQNRLELERFFTVDLFASRSVGRGVELFGAFENLFNDRYSIGRTPVRTVGPPVLARVGFRLNLGSK